ncbi:MAG: PAS domain S-box protein [Blastocatellia bacterium]
MQAGRTSEQIRAEIERLFGFFPNFFHPVLDTPEALESLWQQALTLYVSNPLPAVFKERLFARLSRYCATPYCLVTHSCLMRFLGQSAGEIARVLERPAPASEADIEELLQTLAAADSPLAVWPEPGSRLEEALLHCAEVSFLNSRGAAACRAELRRVLGLVNHAHLIRFLSFVRLAHLWIEAYPEVSYQADERTMQLLTSLIQDEPRLADFFSHYQEIVRRERESCEARLNAELDDLRLVEEALRVSEERYRTLVENAPEAILVVDMETGRFVDANESSVRLFGFEREKLFQSGPADLSPPTAPDGFPARDLASEKLHEALAGGAPVFEWIHRNAAGEDIQCEVRLMRLPGTRNLVRGSITDITERKLAEKARARQLAAMEAVPDGIAILNSDEAYTYMNAAHARIYGYDRSEELIGRTWRELYYDDEIRRIEQEINPLFWERGSWRGELTGRRRDGSVFDVEVSLTALQGNELICVCRDVTERKSADVALRRYTEHLRIMREIDRSILAAQSAEEIASVALRRLREMVPAERITVVLAGPAPAEATVLATDEDNERNIETGKRLPLEPYGELANRISETLRRGETFLLDALNIPDPVPAVREIQTTGRRYYFIVPLLTHGELIGSLSLGTNCVNDLTTEHLEIARGVADGLAIAVEQARLHEQIGQHAAELEKRVAERTAELEAFSYSVSHDLRTPLLTIDGFSRMLLEDYSNQLEAEGQRLLRTICSNSQNMGRLIDDLLAFSRLGRQEMRPSEIRMNELARAVWAELEATAPERKLQFNLHPLPTACGDQAMIRQVLVNLLANAIKFTSPREVAMIEVGAAAEDDHNVYYVKDNGVGFEMKYADKLFGVFQRLHSDSEFAGTGVGLAFVQRIIQRHGGRVWADGKVGEGATLYFALPRKGKKSW